MPSINSILKKEDWFSNYSDVNIVIGYLKKILDKRLPVDVQDKIFHHLMNCHCKTPEITFRLSKSSPSRLALSKYTRPPPHRIHEVQRDLLNMFNQC